MKKKISNLRHDVIVLLIGQRDRGAPARRQVPRGVCPWGSRSWGDGATPVAHHSPAPPVAAGGHHLRGKVHEGVQNGGRRARRGKGIAS